VTKSFGRTDSLVASGLAPGPGPGARAGPRHGSGVGPGWRPPDRRVGAGGRVEILSGAVRPGLALSLLGPGSGRGGRAGRRVAAGGWFMVGPVVIPGGASVPGEVDIIVIFTASASSVSTVRPGVFRALRPPRTALIRRAAGSTAVVAAAPGTSAAAIPVVVVAGEAARRVALLGLHLVWSLAISLSKLDLDLTPANPLPVQVVKGVLRIPDIFELNVSKSSWPPCIEVKWNVDIYNRPITTKLTP